MENSPNATYNYSKESYKHAATIALFDGGGGGGGCNKNYCDDCAGDELSEGQSRCFCCDSDAEGTAANAELDADADADADADSHQSEKVKEKLLKKCFRICLLSCIIIGYTFIGAVIFLVNEDSVSAMTEQITSALISDKLIPPPVSNDSASASSSSSSSASAYLWFSKLGEDSRDKAVQNIWNITVNLNILYRQNWTILAAEELNNFQERLLEKLWQEKIYLESVSYNQDAQRTTEQPPTHWKLGKAFLYSMSILSTIGFGNTVARTSNGKLTTMLYATIGLPVMYMYLSSVGSLLSICARHVFSRTLCCCLCSKCGYCCYDEKLMEEKERRMKRKREQREYQQQIAAAMTAHHSQPFYLKSPSVKSLKVGNANANAKANANNETTYRVVVESKIRGEYSRFLAPLAVCLMFTLLYVLLGSFMLMKFDVSWSMIDSVYFSFMLITTVGIDDSVPLGSALSPDAQYVNSNNSLLVWFFSFYIFVGLAFSSMCYCTIRDGVKRKMNKLYAFSDNLRKSKRNRRKKKNDLLSDVTTKGMVVAAAAAAAAAADIS